MSPALTFLIIIAGAVVFFLIGFLFGTLARNRSIFASAFDETLYRPPSESEFMDDFHRSTTSGESTVRDNERTLFHTPPSSSKKST
jgi:hypothetical protein